MIDSVTVLPYIDNERNLRVAIMQTIQGSSIYFCKINIEDFDKNNCVFCLYFEFNSTKIIASNTIKLSRYEILAIFKNKINDIKNYTESEKEFIFNMCELTLKEQ